MCYWWNYIDFITLERERQSFGWAGLGWVTGWRGMVKLESLPAATFLTSLETSCNLLPWMSSPQTLSGDAEDKGHTCQQHAVKHLPFELPNGFLKDKKMHFTDTSLSIFNLISWLTNLNEIFKSSPVLLQCEQWTYYNSFRCDMLSSSLPLAFLLDLEVKGILK